MPPFDWWEIKEALGMANDPLGAGHAAPELLEGLWTRREGALSAGPVLVATTDSFFPLRINQDYGTTRSGNTHSVKRFAAAESTHTYSFASDHVDIRNAMSDPVALPVGSLSLGFNGGAYDSGNAYGSEGQTILDASPLVYRAAVQSVNSNYFSGSEAYTNVGAAGSADWSIIVCMLTRVGWIPETHSYISARQLVFLRRRSTLAMTTSLSGNTNRDDLCYLVWTRNSASADAPDTYNYRGVVYPWLLPDTSTSGQNQAAVDVGALPDFGVVPVFGLAGSPTLHSARLFFFPHFINPEFVRFDNYGFQQYENSGGSTSATNSSQNRIRRSSGSGSIVIYTGGNFTVPPPTWLGGTGPRYNYSPTSYDPLIVYWTDAGVGWSEGQQNYAKLSTNKSRAIRQLFSTSYGLLILTDEEAFVLRGDYSTNIAQEELPVQVGCDTAASFGACQVDDTVFTVWRGRLWAVAGGTAQPISDGLFLPGDSSQQVAGVAYDSVNQVLLMATWGTGGNSNWYCYDLLRRHWFRPKAGTTVMGAMGLIRDGSGNLLNMTGTGVNGESLQLRATRTARVRYVTDMGDPVNRKVVRHIRFKVRDSNIGAGVTWQIRWSLDNGTYTAWSTLSNKGDGNLYYNFKPQTCREFAFELRAVAAGTNNPVISDDKITELMIEMPIRIAFTRPGGVR